jgi:L-lysine 2,3-aminomutase
MVYPNDEKVDLLINGEYDDWVDDRSNMVVGLDDRVIRKYGNRILYMPTVFCASNCQYCFRQDVLDEARTKKEERTRILKDVKKIEKYLEENPSIEEVILSG